MSRRPHATPHVPQDGKSARCRELIPRPRNFSAAPGPPFAVSLGSPDTGAGPRTEATMSSPVQSSLHQKWFTSFFFFLLKSKFTKRNIIKQGNSSQSRWRLIHTRETALNQARTYVSRQRESEALLQDLGKTQSFTATGYNVSSSKKLQVNTMHFAITSLPFQTNPLLTFHGQRGKSLGYTNSQVRSLQKMR